MSLGLIGKYGSDSDSSISDSDGNDNEDYRDEENFSNREEIEKDGEKLSPVCTDPLSLGLGGSGESEDSDSETNSTPPPSPPGVIGTPLPLPNMDRVVAKNPSYSAMAIPTSHPRSGSQTEGGEGVEENSVFFNPFKKAEEQKLAILKHHVQEFDIKPLVKEGVGHSEVGRGYREARRGYRGARRGYQGSEIPPPRTYAKQSSSSSRGDHWQIIGHHSGGQMGGNSNPQNCGGQINPGGPMEEKNPCQYGRPIGGKPQGPYEEVPEENELFDENDSSLSLKKPRKHRSGVTDSLMPPKKFMRSHEKIQAKERPWTLKK